MTSPEASRRAEYTVSIPPETTSEVADIFVRVDQLKNLDIRLDGASSVVDEGAEQVFPVDSYIEGRPWRGTLRKTDEGYVAQVTPYLTDDRGPYGDSIRLQYDSTAQQLSHSSSFAADINWQQGLSIIAEDILFTTQRQHLETLLRHRTPEQAEQAQRLLTEAARVCASSLESLPWQMEDSARNEFLPDTHTRTESMALHRVRELRTDHIVLHERQSGALIRPRLGLLRHVVRSAR